MTRKKLLKYFLMSMVSTLNVTYAMVFDNRFIPLLQRPRLLIEGNPSSFSIDFFMATATRAIDDSSNEIGIPELFGQFNQAQLARAFLAIGKPNPLRAEWINGTIPWNVEGKIQTQAVTCAYHQALNDFFAVGFSWAFMRVNSVHTFMLRTTGPDHTNLILGPADIRELDDRRRQMFTAARLQEAHDATLGFGDIDAYVRLSNQWEYTAKVRRLDIGARLGVLIPTGVTRDINAPASVPLGGDGHWGVYGTIDGIFEVKEDWKVGIFFRVQKRFARTLCERLVVNEEPYIFSPLVGTVRINPGATVLFSPYFLMENIRRGLGASLQYTLTTHQKDRWSDKRLDKTIPIQFMNVEQQSKWATDYVTLNVFYDFGKEKDVREFDPVVSFRWDIPALFLVTSRVPKTHRVSIGVEFDF